MIQVPELVKDALRDGRLKKNYRFNVLNNDNTVDFTIDNDNLVKESVKIDERMCSGDLLKFGLCEGSSLEFQYFGLANIKGRRIQAFIDVQYIVENPGWNYYGLINNSTSFEIRLTGGYATYKAVIPAHTPGVLTYYRGGSTEETYNVADTDAEQVLEFHDCTTSDKIRYLFYVGALREIGIYYYQKYLWANIPMGYFTVSKCSRQASTGIIKVTAYNKLMSDYLDATANELIDAAVSEGEWGLPNNTASLRTILDRTLGDYSIEVAPDIAQTIAPYGNYKSYNSAVYTRLNSSYQRSGYYMHVFYITHYISITGGFKSDSYYRISINPKAIDDYFEAKRSPMIRDDNDNLYEFTSVDLQPGQTAGTHYTYYDASSAPNYERLVVINSDQTQTLSYSFLTNREINNYDTGWITGISGDRAVLLYLPIYYYENTYYNYPSLSDAIMRTMDEAFEEFMPYLAQHMTIVERNLSTIEKKTFTLADVEAWGDVTLRDLQSAAFETMCQFGQLDRETDLFSGVELNSGGLYPADTLYPSSIYPSGAGVTSNKSYYSKLWTDEHGSESFRNLVITYKGLDANNQEADFEFTKVVNANGTTDYIMDNNWLFRNLVWTQADISDYADAMAAKMAGIRWFPFEMWCAGLPYVETGDLIEVAVGEDTYPSYILQRTLQGIQNLQDTYINGVVDVF